MMASHLLLALTVGSTPLKAWKFRCVTLTTQEFKALLFVALAEKTYQ